MTTLPIPVDDETAAAFQEAPEDTREQITQAVADYMKATVRTEQERADRSASFRRVADEVGAIAQANGRNDELDAALLRGDFDHDE